MNLSIFNDDHPKNLSVEIEKIVNDIKRHQEAISKTQQASLSLSKMRSQLDREAISKVISLT